MLKRFGAGRNDRLPAGEDRGDQVRQGFPDPRGRLGDQDVRDALREVRRVLLEADVNLAVADDFCKQVESRAVGAEILNRFRTFYASFATVMGAQLLIS